MLGSTHASYRHAAFHRTAVALLFAALGLLPLIPAAWGQSTGGNASILIEPPGNQYADSPLGVGDLFDAGRLVYFTGPSDTGGGLWRTDGTLVGTRLIASPCDPWCHVAELDIVAGRADRVFVATPNDFFGRTLWTTDGTEGGLRRLGGWLDDDDGRAPRRWAFGLDDAFVWVDATDDGRVRLAAWNGGEPIQLLPPADDMAVFEIGGEIFVSRVTGASLERWRTDGTPAGTVRLSGQPIAFGAEGVDLNGRWIEIRRGLLPDGGEEIVSTTGEPASDITLTAYSSVYAIGGNTSRPRITRRGDDAYWIAYEPLSGWELWRSDGSPSGTARVTDFPYAGALESGGVGQIATLGAHLLFVAADGVSPCSVWRQAASGPAVRVAPDCPHDLYELGGAVYWTALDEEHRRVARFVDSSGVAHDVQGCGLDCSIDFEAAVMRGSRVLAPIAAPPGVVELQNGAVFRLPGSLHPAARTSWLATAGPTTVAWSSGQSVTDLKLIVVDDHFDLLDTLAVFPRYTSSSSPTLLAASASQAWFTTCLRSRGEDLWSTDGTGAGTVPIALLDTFCTPGYSYHQTRAVGSRALLLGGDTGLRLYGLEGQQRTELLAEREQLLLATGVAPTIGAHDPASGAWEIWTSDATPAGTVLRGTLPAGQGISALLAAGSYAVVASFDPQDGAYRLRVLDPQGQWSVLASGHQYAPIAATLHESRLHVLARPEYGTLELLRLDPGQTTTRLGSLEHGLLPPLSLEVLGPHLLLVEQGPFPPSRWTGSNFEPLAPSGSPPPGESWNPRTARVGDLLLFPTYDEAYGDELWITDGTPAGTRLLADLSPGPSSSFPRELLAAGETAFFVASTSRHGRELWETDGTAEGTRLVQDLSPGSASSAPTGLAASNDRLFFTADDGSLGRETWSLPLGTSECIPGERGLCLGDRHRVEIEWRDFAGRTGRGTPVPLTSDSGAFWFFRDTNIESIVKVLDGRPLNGHEWVFFGSLTNVEFALTVTDVESGVARRWINPSGNFASAADTEAFGPRGADLAGRAPATVLTSTALAPTLVSTRRIPAKAGTVCLQSASVLCLNEGRFSVEATWADFGGNTGSASTREITDDTGSLWFFRPDNLEVLIKVLDGRPVNGAWWVFYGAISNVEYELVVTDTSTGLERRYRNPSGELASVGDTAAFVD